MEGIKGERAVLITLEVPADTFGLKIIRRDTSGYESEEYVCLGMFRDVIAGAREVPGVGEPDE